MLLSDVPQAASDVQARSPACSMVVIEAAAAMIVTVPLAALVLIFQNRIAEGLTAGAVRGRGFTTGHTEQRNGESRHPFSPHAHVGAG